MGRAVSRDDPSGDWASAYPGYIARSELYSRGWTRFLTKKHMREPDKTAPNPHDPSHGSAYLYRRERVAQIEAAAAFRADRDEAARRALAQLQKSKVHVNL